MAEEVNREQVVEEARRRAQVWADHLNLEGEHNVDEIVRTMSQHTDTEGKKEGQETRVTALCVPSPQDSFYAINFGTFARLIQDAVESKKSTSVPEGLRDEYREELREFVKAKSVHKYSDRAFDQLYKQYCTQAPEWFFERLPNTSRERATIMDVVANKGVEIITSLDVDKCIWTYYTLAYYDCVYRQIPNPKNHFAKQSFFNSFTHGLGSVLNFSDLLVGVVMPRIHMNEERLLHRADGPAIEWVREWEENPYSVGVYYWTNIEVPREWIEDPDSVDPMTAIMWENIEQRRAFAEIVGWERVVKKLEPRTIDEDPDELRGGTLLEVDLVDGSRKRFVRVVEPPTGRTFCIPVAIDVNTAREAVAQTYNMTAEEYNPEFRL